MADSKFDVHRFDGRDFFLWKYQMTVFLKGQGLYGVVVDTDKRPVPADANAPTQPEKEAIEKYEQKDNKAMMFLTQALSRGQLAKVVNCNSSKQIWDRLCSVYEQKDETSVHLVQKQFFHYQLQKGDDMATHVSKVEGLARRLKDLGEEVTETAIITQILWNLPPSYRGLMSAWDSTPKAEKTLAHLTARLLKEEEMDKKVAGLHIHEDKSETYAAAGQSRQRHKSDNNKKKFTGKCSTCKKKGHKEADCWETYPEKMPERFRKKAAAAAANAAEGEDAMAAFTGDKGQDGWIADSGATEHMCAVRSWFKDFTPIPEGVYPVRAASKCQKPMFCLGRGTVVVRSQVGSKWINLALTDVLYIPDLGRNLFSLRVVTTKGYSVAMKDNWVEVRKGNDLKARAVSNGKLYHVSFRPVPVSAEALVADVVPEDSLQLWHERLGHVSHAVVRKALNLKGPEKQDAKGGKEAIFCRGCILGKQHRDSFPKGPRIRETKPGTLIHADTCEVTPASIGGNKYFLLIKDDCTSFMFVYPIKSKTQVLDKFKKFLVDWRQVSKEKILKLRTDNGTEFENAAFDSLLANEGIYHELTVPYCPEMNGFIERSNRTVIESARSMIHAARLPLGLWAEAVNTAVHILNRVPCKALGFISPYEEMTGIKPSLVEMKVFGSEGLVHIPDELRSGKMAAKSKPMLLVGYHADTGAYRMYDPKTKKTHKSMFVDWNEKTFGSTPVSQTETQSLDQESVSHSQGDPDAKDSMEIGFSVRFVSEGDPPVMQHESDNETDDEHHNEHENGHGHEDHDNEHHEHDDNEDDDHVHHDEGGNESSDEEEEANVPVRETRRNKDMSQLKWQFGKGLVQTDGSSALVTSAGSEEYMQTFALLASGDPLTVKEALSRPDANEWNRAMQREIEGLKSQNAWTLVPRPEGKSIVQTKWVFRIKHHADGSIDRYKARLVAKGYTQKAGIDFQEIFSPVIRYDSVRFLFALIAGRKLHTKQIDIVGAFLYGDLNETIYVSEPENFETSKEGAKVCKLNKALYGLKQSPRQWNLKFNEFLLTVGLKPTDADPCFYTNKSRTVFMALYVDDGLLAAMDKHDLDKIIKSMEKAFKVTVNETEYFVGIQIHKQADGSVFLNQEAYTKKVLERFGMNNCASVTTPADAYNKLKFNEGGAIVANDYPYRELIGSLMFLMTVTRPDISYAVSALAQYLDKPQAHHVIAGKRLLRYLNGTRDAGIRFSGSSLITGYTDADFAGDEDSRHSRSGMIFFFNNGPVTWQSQKQSTISTSTCEAELSAAFAGTKEAIWLKRFYEETGGKGKHPITLFVDNQGTIKYIQNPLTNGHKRSKHWDIRFKFTKEMQESGIIATKYIQTNQQLADVFTKPLPVSTLR